MSRRLVDHEKYFVLTRVCLCVCLCAAAYLHHCTDPDVTWRSGRGCTLVVHYWADLQSVHGLRCHGNTMVICVTEPSGNASGPRPTPHALRMRAAKTPLAGDKIDAPSACAVPFRPFCGCVATRTQNVSEYMLMLALCLYVRLIRQLLAYVTLCTLCGRCERQHQQREHLCQVRLVTDNQLPVKLWRISVIYVLARTVTSSAAS